MPRKQVALIMTVGVHNESFDNQISRYSASIKQVRPDYIIFYVSDLSIKTLDSIKELIEEDYDGFIEGEDYEVNIIKDIDNFNDCYKQYLNKLLEIYNDYKIIIDYTAGTKTMSASLATCAILFGVDLISVGGLRDNGFVKKGTESIINHNVYYVKDSIVSYLIIKLFNNYRFNDAIPLANHIVSPEFNNQKFVNFLEAYAYWDNVQFSQARESLKKVDFSVHHLDSIRKNLNENLKALSIICTSNSENLKNCYILASLINNARRRAEEYKYDDAIARLYRSFELIAQIKLNSYGIESSNVDINILKEKNVSDDFINYLNKFNEDGKIKIGLISDYLLLNELGDKLGQYFVENRKFINNITYKRNNSILAHGLDSNSKEDFESFEKLVLDLALGLDKSMKRFLFETQFPKFEE